ncbi:MAG: hypothetical protein HC871_01270 [Rhizobiales bacterium]|nr:hypothetical protein [Hyphomicrobiales bacterium]
MTRRDMLSREYIPTETVVWAICADACEARDVACCPFSAGPVCSLSRSLDAHG